MIAALAALSSAAMVASIMPFLTILSDSSKIRSVEVFAWFYDRLGFSSDFEFVVALGIASLLKTSGSKGLHIYVPVAGDHDSIAVRQAAVALARELERRHPDVLTAAWWKEERGERIFVDFNQNAPHKTVFGAWCARPRVGGQVSTPVSWDELATVAPEQLTVLTVPAKVSAEGDPWAGMRTPGQDISTLLEWFWRDIDDGLMDAPWPPVYPKMPLEPPRVAPSRAKKTEE